MSVERSSTRHAPRNDIHRHNRQTNSERLIHCDSVSTCAFSAKTFCAVTCGGNEELRKFKKIEIYIPSSVAMLRFDIRTLRV
jgi:hypothetical protein